MAEMEAVEHTEGQHAGRADLGIVKITENVHRKAIESEANEIAGRYNVQQIAVKPLTLYRAPITLRASLHRFYRKPVISDLDARGQLIAGRGMSYVMRDMRQQGATRAQALNVTERLVYGHVGRVRLEAQGINHQQVKPPQSRTGFVGNQIAVGDISKITDAVRRHRQLAMNDGERFNL